MTSHLAAGQRALLKLPWCEPWVLRCVACESARESRATDRRIAA